MNLYAVLEHGAKPRRPTQAVLGLTAFALAWTVAAPWLHRQYNLVFELVFMAISLYCLARLFSYYHASPGLVRRLLVAHMACFAFAGVLWLVDRLLCMQLRALGWRHAPRLWPYIGSLHGYWHVLMAVATHCALVYATYWRLRILGRHPHIVWLLGAVPFIETKESSALGGARHNAAD